MKYADAWKELKEWLQAKYDADWSDHCGVYLNVIDVMEELEEEHE